MGPAMGNDDDNLANIGCYDDGSSLFRACISAEQGRFRCDGIDVLVPRYIVFTLGETGVVGVAMLPLILVGLSLIVRLNQNTLDQYGSC